MHPAQMLVLLFAAATGVALVTRRLGIPYTVAVVLTGLALGSARRFTESEFRKSSRAIFALAVSGVVVAIGATATLVVAVSHATRFATGFRWPQALVFAALIAATHPIAVVAIFKSLGAPKRLGVLIEGESLVNDGTSIVLFTIVYAAVTGNDRYRVSAI
jgi:CPA1 family monovalent cation:H+ antiporter